MNYILYKYALILIFTLLQLSLSYSQTHTKLLVLQDMSWVDVQEYLKTNDMAIIPIGSTEQHGPHLPLGTDYYTALEVSKMISMQTGIVVAPVLLSGYSAYHSGFPGTLSLKPETMEQVLFETVEILRKYGFKRFLFFNGHGGNNIVQSKLIHRINHNTEAIAVSIGYGSDLQKKKENPKEEDFFDWHAGKKETSIMLHLFPQLVKMNMAEKPEIHFTPQMEELKALSEENPDILPVWDNLIGVPAETKKGGASHEISSNGIWSFHDPKSASEDIGRTAVDELVKRAVKFIEVWKQAKE